MGDASYITKLREAQTIVASRFVPRVNNTAQNNNLFSLPKGFSIIPTISDKVIVDINGDLNISRGIHPTFLQLKPQDDCDSQLDFKGKLWVKKYTNEPNRFTLKLDNNTIYDTKPITFETLNGVNITVDTIKPSILNNENIKISGNLIPTEINKFTLGDDKNRWDHVYTNKLHVRDKTIFVEDDNGNEMSISYDIKNIKSFFTSNDITVEAVTTSKNIPGQIDPSLLPFSGVSFASKINITEYKNNVGSNSLLDQILYSIYTLDKSVITNKFDIPIYNPVCNITKIISLLNGNYYVVINSNKSTEKILLPKIRASTNFTDNTGSLNITSSFTIVSEELVDVSDGDILIIYYSYIPNGDNFDIIFGFQNINFRLPINSVSNTNILNDTLTTSKLKDNIITNTKIADASISLRTFSSEVFNYINSNIKDNSQLDSFILQIRDLENKYNKIEKYIKILSNTYFIKDTISGNTITLDNIGDIELN